MNNGDGAEAGLVLLTQLLGLLAGFIGEGLMLHLVHDVFPQVNSHEYSMSAVLTIEDD